MQLQWQCLLSQGCHATCSSPVLRSGSYCVLHLTSFIRSSFVPLPHVRSYAFCFRSWHTLAVTLSLSKCAQSLSQAQHLLTWFHYTPSSLLYFSKVQSTRCLLLFCSPVAPLRLRSPCVAIAHVILPFYNAPLSLTCIVLPPSYRLSAEIYFGGFLCCWHRPLSSAFPASTLVGARRPPPFSRSSFSPAAVSRLATQTFASFGRRRFYRNKYKKGSQKMTAFFQKKYFVDFYSSTTLAPDAFDFTDSIPLSLPEDESYISLVPMICPLEAFRLK